MHPVIKTKEGKLLVDLRVIKSQGKRSAVSHWQRIEQKDQRELPAKKKLKYVISLRWTINVWNITRCRANMFWDHFFVATSSTVTGHLATRKFRLQLTRHQETISPPSKVCSPPNPNKNESTVCRGYLSIHKLRYEHVGEVIDKCSLSRELKAVRTHQRS